MIDTGVGSRRSITISIKVIRKDRGSLNRPKEIALGEVQGNVEEMEF